MSRNGMVVLSLALATLAAVGLSLGAYFFGVAVVELDPDHPGNYGGAQGSSDATARAEVREEQAAQTMTAWIVLSASGALAVGAMAVAFQVPPKEHKHVR